MSEVTGAGAASRALEGLAALQPLMDACVHCGFCLSTCPSYVLGGRETESPRGRIHLMKAAVQDRIALADPMIGHIDTCLGCLACETACPSGVRYGPLVEATRDAIERQHPRSFGERAFRRALFLVLPHPMRLRLLARPMAVGRAIARRPSLLRLLPSKLRALLQLAPDGPTLRDVPERTPAAGACRLTVGLLTGCVQRVFFGHVNEATVRVLTAEGCEVVAPSGQGCCGALALHAGRGEEARRFARSLIAAFEGHELDAIVVNAAGCGSTMKEYGELLRGDPDWADRARAFSARVRDVTETLAGLDPRRATRHPLALTVAYHDACHLAHGQGVRREPRALLASIPALSVAPVAESEICCGSAGIFNLVQPEMADALGRRKAGHLDQTRADLIVTSNPGCVLQIRAASRAEGHARPIVHIMELVDASVRGVEAARFVRDAGT